MGIHDCSIRFVSIETKRRSITNIRLRGLKDLITDEIKLIAPLPVKEHGEYLFVYIDRVCVTPSTVSSDLTLKNAQSREGTEKRTVQLLVMQYYMQARD